jgi:predicted alpha/beta hydrolase
MSAERIDNTVDFPPFRVPAAWYAAEQPRATLLLIPALGTAAGYYQPFAEAAAGRGLAVLVPELPGTGESRPRPSRAADYGYGDLVERYLPELAALARDKGGGRPLVLAGHSLGAQLALLARASGQVVPQALVTVAGGLIHYRYWDGAGAIGMRGVATLVTGLSCAFGYLPGKVVGFGGPQAKTLMRQWSHAIRHGRFAGFDLERRPSDPVPALSIWYEGDRYAPRRSAAAMAAALGGDLQCLGADRPGNPHASWARHPQGTLDCIEEWLAAARVMQPAGD